DRLCLRPPQLSDAGAMQLYASDPRVAMMTGSIPHPYPPGAAEVYLRNAARPHGERRWAIDATPSGGAEFIGIVGYKQEVAEIGYWVGPPFWNTGYATESVAAVIAHVFQTENIAAINAGFFVDNPASGAVLEKLGFRWIGTAMRFSVARGAEGESRLGRLMRDDWAAQTADRA
ncbi:MAG: GNAT family N-acetyltransferase, partial [Pseudomonadota bacterium]